MLGCRSMMCVRRSSSLGVGIMRGSDGSRGRAGTAREAGGYAEHLPSTGWNGPDLSPFAHPRNVGAKASCMAERSTNSK